jgi:hypothetical protein
VKSGAKEDALALAFGGARVAGVTVVAGLPSTGLAGVVTGAAIRLLLRALIGSRYEGTTAVIAQLVRR